MSQMLWQSAGKMLRQVHPNTMFTPQSYPLPIKPPTSNIFPFASNLITVIYRHKKADIIEHSHVSLEDKAECVHRFTAMADVQMHVCGTCGIRDIFDPYTNEVQITAVNSDHWLRVGQEGYARLKECDDLQLLRPDGCGGYQTVVVQRTLLHSLVEIEGRAYHVVPEAILEDNKVKLCKTCARGWNKDTIAKRSVAPDVAASMDFEDMYALNAPAYSIARGADFGRLSGLKGQGISTDVSTLERLVLAEARCHQIIYKVVAYGKGTDRKRLHGHSIVCPQKAVVSEHSGFGRAALLAAYAAVKIVFVGPSGVRGKLEQSALMIDDLRLRPDVLFNFLTINHKLHNGPCPPTIEEVCCLIAEHSLSAHIKDNARSVVDTQIEEESAASDIANVRSHAQSTNIRLTNEDPLEDTIHENDALPPHMLPIGLFESNPQPMEAVIKGISRIFIEGEGGNGDDNPIRDISSQAHTENIYMQREANICTDYGGAADVLYKTWWPLMPLRRGFVRNASIPDTKMRQVFMYFDNRFAHDMSLVFHAANMMMRHAVNRAVTARVKTSPEAFAQFKILLHDGNFLQMLQDARDNPKGKTAREVVTKVIGFINLSAGKIPWGGRERAAEMTKLIADTRYLGPSSIFYSMSPDDVHNATTIRWAMPYISHDAFPAKIQPDFFNALRGTEASERMAYAPNGRIFPMDETSLQLLAAKNPVACAITFHHLTQNVRENLIGTSSNRLVNEPMKKRRKGMLHTTIAGS